MQATQLFANLQELAPNLGEGSRIALLDTGVDPLHPDFADANITCGDMVSPGGNGFDIDGHGTACAGIILRIAPRCTLLSGRILDRSGSFTYDCLISGLYWAGIRKADVICICSGARHADLLAERKLEDLGKVGCVIVAAAGNHGRQGPGTGVFPARSPCSIAIGTANDAGELSLFTTLPDGKDVYCLRGEEFETTTLKGAHELMTGTSASAAAMAGILGLMSARRGQSTADWQNTLAKGSTKCISARGEYLLVDPFKLLSQAS